MKETRIIMGMPVSVDIAEGHAAQADLDAVFAHFEHVDAVFSTYKSNSEISRINRGKLDKAEWSEEMREVFVLSEETKQITDGYFDIQKPDGSYDPSGLVKGWAAYAAAKILWQRGFDDFYIDVGGDIQTSGKNGKGGEWSVGIRNPFAKDEIIKVLYPRGRGTATSGTYIRGEHIYDPHVGAPVQTDIVSFTVIGPDIYEADRFATAAFAMGQHGIGFIEELEGFEGYAVDVRGRAVMTSGFDAYTKDHAQIDR